MAISIMLQGIHLAFLQESLLLDPLADLLVRAKKYILHMKVMQTMKKDENKEQKRKERHIEGDPNQ